MDSLGVVGWLARVGLRLTTAAATTVGNGDCSATNHHSKHTHSLTGTRSQRTEQVEPRTLFTYCQGSGIRAQQGKRGGRWMHGQGS